ncbi:lipoyl(octanoyl) transferase [Syntrophus gentianae]|uniref:Octanoyltransferase n=1 Tax=Syntrophus gentianae TaxID=43775 RepID=A0A1H7Y2K3_9BACT|nr:lipoyl(octanoyl) transferase LipB [Syntrophus gentianae]SEM40094.1 lipoyl(octanoyl) transferase [Syntrophus gentianae]
MTGRKPWFCADLPLLDYRKARDLQLELVAARKAGILPANILLLLEHNPIFTLGHRSRRDNLTVSEDLLQERGIPLVRVERGGDITFHGPGQLVGYPIMNLHAARLTVTDYVDRLEEVMIRTAESWGVRAGRNAINRGVWVGNAKLGSIGIGIRHGITFHGFAFNVNLSLEPFAWINPCGLKGIGITSLKQELSREVSMEKVREQMKQNIQAVFDVAFEPMDLSGLSRFQQAGKS